MSITASYKEHILKFKFPAGTSRGVLTEKKVYYIMLRMDEMLGIGECSVIPGLSIDDRDDYKDAVEKVCNQINEGMDFRELNLAEFPSISFGLETALLDVRARGSKVLFKNQFTEGKAGIPINGLVWMGDKAFMEEQVRKKIEAGFRCIKLKIGAIDFAAELDIIADIRKNFPENTLEIRLDANGAFDPQHALEKLKRLSDFGIHSIEQPIKAGQWLDMAALCAVSPIPVALDEELIGIHSEGKKEQILSVIQPDYIILKPGLLGGLEKAQDWINLAKRHQVGWWVTSALESNIGLNAIAQWTSSLNTSLPQGLGTGQLYTNNIPSPLAIVNDKLYHIPSEAWDLSEITK
jgi:o-succinylbenzoate synthase